MNTDIEKAAELLLEKNATCVFVRQEYSVVLHERGISPLMEMIKEGGIMNGCSAADRVIGKAAAFLHVMLGVKEVYAKVISNPALEVLEKAGVVVHFEKCVDRIINREGSGLCPMEAAVIDIRDVYKAYQVLRDLDLHG